MYLYQRKFFYVCDVTPSVYPHRSTSSAGHTARNEYARSQVEILDEGLRSRVRSAE